MRFRDWLFLSGVTLASTLGCASEVDVPDVGDPSVVTVDDKGDGSGLTELVLTEADDGRTVTATEGELVVVRLPSDPSSGYAWKVGSTNRRFGEPWVMWDFDAEGAETTVLTWWTTGPFRLVGRHHVHLEYRRASDSDVARAFTFTVEIEPRVPPAS